MPLKLLLCVYDGCKDLSTTNLTITHLLATQPVHSPHPACSWHHILHCSHALAVPSSTAAQTWPHTVLSEHNNISILGKNHKAGSNSTKSNSERPFWTALGLWSSNRTKKLQQDVSLIELGTDPQTGVGFISSLGVTGAMQNRTCLQEGWIQTPQTARESRVCHQPLGWGSHQDLLADAWALQWCFP